MDTEKILTFLSQLERNNNAEWFHAHKREYNEAKAEFEALIGELICAIGKFDDSVLFNEPKSLTFKLNRDTRFSNDKSPYNASFRAHISSKGKLPVPVGYYIMIKPNGNTFLGGGLFADMFKDATKSIRDRICADPREWESVINDGKFARYFTVKGSALKNVPQGYDKESPQAGYLKYKSWYVEYFLDDETVKDPNKLVPLAADVFSAMKPFNDFINEALKDFKLPFMK